MFVCNGFGLHDFRSLLGMFPKSFPVGFQGFGLYVSRSLNMFPVPVSMFPWNLVYMSSEYWIVFQEFGSACLQEFGLDVSRSLANMLPGDWSLRFFQKFGVFASRRLAFMSPGV